MEGIMNKIKENYQHSNYHHVNFIEDRLEKGILVIEYYYEEDYSPFSKQRVEINLDCFLIGKTNFFDNNDLFDYSELKMINLNQLIIEYVHYMNLKQSPFDWFDDEDKTVPNSNIKNLFDVKLQKIDEELSCSSNYSVENYYEEMLSYYTFDTNLNEKIRLISSELNLFYKKLDEIMTKKNLSNSILKEVMGVSASTISRYRSGHITSVDINKVLGLIVIGRFSFSEAKFLIEHSGNHSDLSSACIVLALIDEGVYNICKIDEVLYYKNKNPIFSEK